MHDSNFITKKSVPFRPRVPDDLRDELQEVAGDGFGSMQNLCLRLLREGVIRERQRVIDEKILAAEDAEIQSLEEQEAE